MRIIRNWSHTNRGPTMSQLELWCTARPNSEQPPRKQYPSHSHCLIVDISHDTWWLTVHDFHYFRFSNVGAFELICTGHYIDYRATRSLRSPHSHTATRPLPQLITTFRSGLRIVCRHQLLTNKWTYLCFATMHKARIEEILGISKKRKVKLSITITEKNPSAEHDYLHWCL